MVALSLLYWSIYLCFRYFDRFRTLSCNFQPASSNFPPSIPLIFIKLSTQHQPAITRIENWAIFQPRVCSSATHLFVHFQKYLRTPKQYSSIQQRILAWTNFSHRARRHVWCWVEFHPHHCLRGAFGIRTWLWRYTCLLLLISMLWHRQAIFESKGDMLSSSAEGRIRTHQGLRHQIASRLNARW